MMIQLLNFLISTFVVRHGNAFHTNVLSLVQRPVFQNYQSRTTSTPIFSKLEDGDHLSVYTDSGGSTNIQNTFLSTRKESFKLMTASLLGGLLPSSSLQAFAEQEVEPIELENVNEISSSSPSIDSTYNKAPFQVKLTIQLDPKIEEESELIIEVRPDWAPIASNRFLELVDLGFYDGSRFFRVLPSYVAQFGIAADPKLNQKWIFCEKGCRSLPDEPRLVSNKRGTLSFASSGKNSRQTQIFINLSNNGGPPNFLDAQNFVPFAQVISGMDSTVAKLNSDYGLTESLSGGLAGSVNQGKAAYYGEEYLEALFPKLSIIKKVALIK